MKITYHQAAHQLIISLTLLLSIGCAPTVALSDCDHDHPQKEASILLPDFGFNFSGACSEAPSEAIPENEAEKEDDLLKDIGEPLEEPSSDLAVALEENHQTS